MFTGLVRALNLPLQLCANCSTCLLRGLSGQIEHLGTVVDVQKDEGGCTLVIGHSTEILDDCNIGDSIAVNGACLTVTEFKSNKEDHGGWFKVWLANETLERTDFRAYFV
jgi:riboflavin synthase alpha subunit